MIIQRRCSQLTSGFQLIVPFSKTVRKRSIVLLAVWQIAPSRWNQSSVPCSHSKKNGLMMLPDQNPHQTVRSEKLIFYRDANVWHPIFIFKFRNPWSIKNSNIWKTIITKTVRRISKNFDNKSVRNNWSRLFLINIVLENCFDICTLYYTGCQLIECRN